MKQLRSVGNELTHSPGSLRDGWPRGEYHRVRAAEHSGGQVAGRPGSRPDLGSSRAAAVIAPGALVMALIYAWARSPACTSPRGHLRFHHARRLPAHLGPAVLAGAVRGMPRQAEWEAAEGRDVPVP